MIGAGVFQRGPMLQAEKANIEAVKCAQIAQQAKTEERTNIAAIRVRNRATLDLRPSLSTHRRSLRRRKTACEQCAYRS